MACLAGLVLSTNTDPDLWGHVRFGHDIVRQRAVSRVDTYSFTTDRPWINHEWLSEVLMYTGYAVSGPAGLIALKVFLCVGAAITIVRQLSRYSLPLEVRTLLFVVAIAGTKAQTGHVRPQLFSLFLFTLLVSVLTTVERRSALALVVLPVIFLFWTNLHGGWILGAGVLAIWAATRMLDSRKTPNRGNVAAAVASSAAATLINPFGINLWTFLLQTVRVDRNEIIDWQPVTYSTDLLLVWLFIAGTCGVLLFRTRRMPSLFTSITLGLLAAGSFRVLRLESFFALGVAMLLPRELAPPRAPGVFPLPKAHPISRLAGFVVMGVASCAIALFSVLIGRNGSCIQIGMAGNPEPEAASFVRMNGLHGRMLTWFDWGEYAIWHFSPAIQVSLDGRRETAYSDRILQSHLDFYWKQEPGGSTIAELWKADYVWLPKDLAVVNVLRTGGWTPVFDGPISTILSRTQTGSFRQPQRSMQSRRCFPGP